MGRNDIIRKEQDKCEQATSEKAIHYHPHIRETRRIKNSSGLSCCPEAGPSSSLTRALEPSASGSLSASLGVGRGSRSTAPSEGPEGPESPGARFKGRTPTRPP